MTNAELKAAREHLAKLMDKARLAGDAELYQDLQDQLARTYPHPTPRHYLPNS